MRVKGRGDKQEREAEKTRKDNGKNKKKGTTKENTCTLETVQGERTRRGVDEKRDLQ